MECASPVHVYRRTADVNINAVMIIVCTGLLSMKIFNAKDNEAEALAVARN
jgi:hypothetical protein